MENTQPTLPEGCGPGYDNSTCDNNPSPQPTLPEGCGPGYDNSTCGSSTPSSQLSLHDQICNAYHNDAVKALARSSTIGSYNIRGHHGADNGCSGALLWGIGL